MLVVILSCRAKPNEVLPILFRQYNATDAYLSCVLV